MVITCLPEPISRNNATHPGRVDIPGENHGEFSSVQLSLVCISSVNLSSVRWVFVHFIQDQFILVQFT